MSIWIWVTSALLFGYLSLSRSFAYLGIPTWKVFVGEVILGLFLILGPRVGRSSWLKFSLKIPSLREFWIWYALFFVYGFVEVLYGIRSGHPPLLAMRDLAFQYYPLYFLLGLWAGIKRPTLLPELLRGFAWFNGVYGILYILFLSRIQWIVPGVSDEVSDVSIFGEPLFSFVALLGVIAYEKDLRRCWYLLLMNGFVMLGMQFRAEWLAFAIGMLAWAILSRKGKRVIQTGAVLACLFGFLYITDFSIPSPEGRAEADFSARQLVDRAAAPFRADLSNVSVAAGATGVDSQEGTFVFRTVWWLAIWDSVHTSPATALFGFGYGYALGDLVPYLAGRFIRTPHNAFFYALGYTGWVGVALLVLFWWEILRLLWRARAVTGEPFGVALWVAMIALAMFFPMGETPYGAIPFYLLTGLASGLGLFPELSGQGGKERIFQGYRLGHVSS
jgi:hypothetical protein